MYEKYFDVLKVNCLDSRLHGFLHAKHVFMIAEKLLDFYPQANKKVVLMASLFHDVKRKDDTLDEWHGSRSANWFKENINQDEIIFKLIRDHNKNIENPSLEMQILKDSDALSRVRFCGFNPQYLLIPEYSIKLVDFAKESWMSLNEPDNILNILNTELTNGISELQRIKFASDWNYLLNKRGMGDLFDFVRERHFLPDQLYYQYLRVWLSHNYHHFVINTLRLLLRERGNQHYLMYVNEYEAFKQLPDTLQIYRGCIERNKDGLSYSLNRDEAQNYCKENGGFVIEKKINKADTIALFMDLGKNEILLR